MSKHIMTQGLSVQGLVGTGITLLDRILCVGLAARERVSSVVPSLVNAQPGSAANCNAASVFTFTPGTDGTCVLLKWVISTTQQISSAVCVPSSGPTITLTSLVNQAASNTRIGLMSGVGFQPGITYTVTLTYSTTGGTGVAWVIAAYKSVGQIRTPVVIAGGTTTPVSLSVPSDTTRSLITDMVTVEGGTARTWTPTQAGQTAESGQLSGQADIATSWRVATATPTVMGWSASPAVGSGTTWMIAVELSALVDVTVDARVEGAPTFSLLEATTDAFYVGYDSQFPGVRVDIDVAGVGLALVWEYWNGTAWTALASVAGAASGLTADGEVTWTKPTDWARSTWGGSTMYFARVRTTTLTTPPTAFFVVVNWTIYDNAAGTYTKVYRSIGEDGVSPMLLWCNDNAPWASGRHTAFRFYETWDAALHTGTAPCPTTTQQSVGCGFTKSTSADALARNVYAYVSRDRIILNSDDTWTAVYANTYLGRFKSYVAGDPFNVCLCGHVGMSSSGERCGVTNGGGASISGGNSGHWIQRNYTGAGGSIANAATSILGVGLGNTQYASYPNGPNGGLIITPKFLLEHTGAGVGHFRGELEGVVLLPHVSTAGLTNLDRFTDPTTGKQYYVIRSDVGNMPGMSPWYGMEIPV